MGPLPALLAHLHGFSLLPSQPVPFPDFGPHTSSLVVLLLPQIEDSVRFAEESPKPEKGQLLENVFSDPRGFGIAPDGRYRYELPGFSSGTAAVS